MARKFQGNPIVAWAIDKFDVILNACRLNGVNYERVVDSYKRNVYANSLENLFTQSPFKLNLGGATDKAKITTTDKPTGVFNFSLASRSLFPVPEYYSKDLAEQYPDRFKGLELLPGLIPADMIQKQVIGNEVTFVFKDSLNGKEFLAVKRKKGETAIDLKIPGAKIKYSSKEKKVFQFYKRKGGKVKYVEIYSLFYYDNLSGDFQFGVRHIPAMMVAEYLESQGIKVRFYMTRFVLASKENAPLRTVGLNGMDLPMGNVRTNRKARYLIVQPIIAKDFQQDFDRAAALCISSDNYNSIYESCATYSVHNDTESAIGIIQNNTSNYLYGNPNFPQNDYWEGIERYRNKYQEYVKLGIFESKEVLPLAMIFFHDMSINKYFRGLSSRLRYTNKYSRKDEEQIFLQPDANRFFVWWMKTSANVIKHKINIINSSNYSKEFREIEKDLNETAQECAVIINETQDTEEKEIYKEFSKKILEILHIEENGVVSVKSYINYFVDELTTFADGDYYATPDKEVELRLEMKKNIFIELKKI